MEGKVIQFRRGRHTYKKRHFILDFGLTKKTDAEKLVGKNVEWTSSAGKIINGKIAASHGSNGKVRAIFERGLPGQALTTKVVVK
jgi:large subunit ribosomal protein L35Ae